MIDMIDLLKHCGNIKEVCDEFVNQDPICYDPGNNYEELVYISGQINRIIDLIEGNET